MHRDDVEAVHGIHTLCVTQSMAGHYRPEQLRALMEGRTARGYWEAAQNGETFLIAELEGAIAGYASWREDELISLFVVPPAQDRGIGRLLFLACAAAGPITYVRATLNAVDFFRALAFQSAEPGFRDRHGVRIPHLSMTRQVGQAPR